MKFKSKNSDGFLETSLNDGKLKIAIAINDVQFAGVHLSVVQIDSLIKNLTALNTQLDDGKTTA